jgi:energy-coupling factor transporter transmembrane protein EcfT
MPFVYMIAAVGIMTLFSAFVSGLERRRASAYVCVAVLLLFFIALPAWSAYASRPHYALYTNMLGGGRAGYFFPHDEFYDDGLREAIRYVTSVAPQGATIVHETPGVVRYYLQKFGREDMQSRVLSDAKFDLAGAPKPAYVILQRGRTYFENRQKMATVRASYPKVHEVFVQGVSAVEVYAVE